MRPLLRFLAPALLSTFAAAAQPTAGPLPADPARAVYLKQAQAATQRRGAAVALPFFDDFTTPREGFPSSQNWQPPGPGYPNGAGADVQAGTGGAFVSNRYGVAPPSRGTATLDGLAANGQPYAIGTSIGATDTLTSQPINLAGFAAANNVRLSFAWQSGTAAGPPAPSAGARPIGLDLDFLDNAGRWVLVWSFRTGPQAAVSNFRQQIFAIAQPQYLHGGFRFRLRASGDRTSVRDGFGVDYVYVNDNRPANDTTFNDIATSRGLDSPLRRYTSMPVWQFNAAGPANALNPNLTATYNDLTPAAPVGRPTIIEVRGTVRDLPAGSLGFGPATWLFNNPISTPASRQNLVGGDARTAALPTTPGAKRFRYTLALTTNEGTSPQSSVRTLPNDTLRRDLELADYYAYDDGTAEYYNSLPAASTGPSSFYAYQFETSQADQVAAVRLAPVFSSNSQGTSDNGRNRPVVVAVWPDDGTGQPANTPLATQTASLTNPLPAGQVFYDVRFATPVPVSGRFYVGYGQAASGNFYPYGLDRNNPLPNNALWYYALVSTPTGPQSGWQTAQLQLPGAIMMRPVMNNNVLSTRANRGGLTAAFALYPNPAAPGAVQVSGPAFRQAALLDALGRTVWQQPAAEAGRAVLNLPATLPAGLYVVRLALPDGATVAKRLEVK